MENQNSIEVDANFKAKLYASLAMSLHYNFGDASGGSEKCDHKSCLVDHPTAHLRDLSDSIKAEWMDKAASMYQCVYSSVERPGVNQETIAVVMDWMMTNLKESAQAPSLDVKMEWLTNGDELDDEHIEVMQWWAGSAEGMVHQMSSAIVEQSARRVATQQN